MFWYGVWWEEEYQYYEDGLLDAHFCLVFFSSNKTCSSRRRGELFKKLLHWVKVGSWIRYLDWRGMRDTQWTEQRKLAFLHR
jgi:hypothetical protein